MNLLRTTALLALAFAVTGLVPVAEAQVEEVPIRISDVSGEVGETVSVDVRVENLDDAADITAYGFDVEFSDSDVASLAGIETAGTLSGQADEAGNWQFVSGNNRVGAGGDTPLNQFADTEGRGVLVTLNISIDDNGSTEVRLSEVTGGIFNDGDPPPADQLDPDFKVIASDNVLSVPNNIEATSGQSVRVPVNASGFSDGIGPFGFDLTYNSSVLSNPRVDTVGTITGTVEYRQSGGEASGSEISDGRFRIGGTSPDSVQFSGQEPLVFVEFDVDDAEFSPVRFNEDDIDVTVNGESTGFATKNGSVDARNATPVIDPLSDVTIDEDASTTVDVSISDDDDAIGDLNTEVSSSNPGLIPGEDGTLELSGTGSPQTLTLAPSADSNGTAVITVSATDPSGASDEETFELDVTPVDDAPVAVNDTFDVSEDESLRVSAPEGVLENDRHPDDGESFQASEALVSQADNGSVTLSTDGSFEYIPNADFAGTDQFEYEISDGDLTDTAIVTINVEQVNDPPTITAISDTTIEEDGSTGPIEFTIDDLETDATDLVVNDSTGNPGLVPEDSIEIEGEGAEKTVTVTPTADSNGTAEIKLTVVDQKPPTTADEMVARDSSSTTFTLTVNPVNDPPTITAISDTTIDEDESTGPIEFTVNDLETPPEELILEDSTDNPDLIESIELGGSGADRTVTVTPAADSNGTADITITAEDGGQKTASETFTLTVDPVNEPPTISGLPEADTIDEDSQAGPIGFSVDDVETDASDLTVTGSSGNPDLVPDDSIELGFSPDGRALVATPSADSNGTADIVVTVEDDNGATDSDTLTLEVTPVDDAPVAVDDQYSTDQGEGLRVSAPEGVLENDRHPDGEPFTASEALVSTPGDGSVNLSADGSFEYTPETGFAGTDQFVYEVSDGDSTDTATVTIDVQAVEAVISGTVSYPEEGENELTGGRPLSGVPVEISAPSGDVAARDTTGNDGTFSATVQAGEYTVEALFGERDVPGVINATDANRTIGAFLGDSPFVSDFQREVADVNDSGSANATDALKMALFFIDRDGTTFEAGDWATTARTVDVSDGTGTDVSVLAAAYGDANLSGGEQSGEDAVAATASTAAGSSAGSQARTNDDRELRGVGMEETFEVPVRLNGGEATVGSYSLQVDFPAEKVSFEGVAGTERDVMSAAEGGTVRLSWFDQSGDEPVKLGSGAELVTLRFRAAKSAEKGMAFAPEVTVGELAGPDAEPLTSARLSVEGVEIGSTLPEEFALEGNYPNPTSGQATIEMNLPSRTDVTVEVYNALGQRVQVIEQSMAAGTGQTVRVDGSRLASGQYFYRVKADLEDSTVRKTGRITVVR